MNHVSPRSGFQLPPRGSKPRQRGVTSVIDFGPDTFGWTGPAGVSELLTCTADYIDYAKIYALNALLLPLDVVRSIVRLYREAGVKTYSGGILFEYAHKKGEIDGLLAHLEATGIGALEISENYITLDDEERKRYIDAFAARGFSVIYEFGRKNPVEALSIDELESIVSTMLGRGVAHIIIEQSEIDVTSRSAPEALRALARKPWFDRLLIEADPYRFPQQHAALIKDFGPEVNLANIAPGQALRLEGLRRGIGRAVNYSLLESEGSN